MPNTKEWLVTLIITSVLPKSSFVFAHLHSRVIFSIHGIKSAYPSSSLKEAVN